MNLYSAFGRAAAGWLELLGSLVRKRVAEEKGSRRNQKLQRPPDVPPEMVATIGPDGLFKTANRACKAILGYEPEELLGRSYVGLVHPDDRDRSAVLIAAVADGVDEARLENRLRRKNGSITRIEWYAAAVPEAGAVRCLGREVADRGRSEGEVRRRGKTFETRLMELTGRLEAKITELEHNERELRESEKLFRSLVQNSISDIVTVLETDGTVRYYESPAIERVLGHKPGERAGTYGFGWLHPDDVERALSIFAEVLQTPGIHAPIEFRVPHVDGSWRYLEHTANNQLDDPDIRGIVVSSRDITVRKRAEEALRRSEERFRSLVQNGSDVVTVLDADARSAM